MTRTAADVARSAYELGGGASLFENSDLQRRFRDAYAATQHIMTSADTYEMVGRVFFGAPPDGALI
jgi:alkylation response protein AidB-like acyl-CoA dehydrogenase